MTKNTLDTLLEPDLRLAKLRITKFEHFRSPFILLRSCTMSSSNSSKEKIPSPFRSRLLKCATTERLASRRPVKKGFLATKTETFQWRIPPPPPLFLDQTEARMAENIFWRPPPTFLRVLMNTLPPPLCQGPDPALPLKSFNRS